MDRIDKSTLDDVQASKTKDFLDTASKQGLRTLLMGMRVVSEDEVENFKKKCEEAERDIANSEAKLDTLYSDFE